MVQMSDKGVEALIKMEGEELKPYKDSAGFWTIGVGHKLLPSELMSGKILIEDSYGVEIQIRYWDGITKEQSKQILMDDLDVFEQVISHGIDYPVLSTMEHHQIDAMISFAFNVGGAAFLDSTLLKKINNQEFDEVPTQLRRWVYAGGKKYLGLVNRREKEIKIWHGNYSV